MSLEEIMAQAIASSVWKVAPVSQAPSITLTNWSIRHATDGDHFVGTADYYGRVSTPIVTFDEATKKGITTSGRIYQLVGEPGHSGDAEHTWGMYKDINQITEL